MSEVTNKKKCTGRKFILLQFSLRHLCLHPFIAFSQPPWQKQLQNLCEYEFAFKLPAASFTPDEQTGARMQTGLSLKLDPENTEVNRDLTGVNRAVVNVI